MVLGRSPVFFWGDLDRLWALAELLWELALLFLASFLHMVWSFGPVGLFAILPFWVDEGRVPVPFVVSRVGSDVSVFSFSSHPLLSREVGGSGAASVFPGLIAECGCWFRFRHKISLSAFRCGASVVQGVDLWGLFTLSEFLAPFVGFVSLLVCRLASFGSLESGGGVVVRPGPPRLSS